MLIGRNEENRELLSLLESERSEFVAVYGRRRVGKTFLVRETFAGHFAFQHTGIFEASAREQLEEFRASLYASGMRKCPKLRNWYEAFRFLGQHLDSLSSGKKVVFIDELPWMDTPRANFIRALDHFWNGWASARNDILLVICGSATSWIIDKVIMNYGGLHNRLTKQIYLRPFTLRECEEYCEYRRLEYTRNQILEGYMALGGIPYYWGFLEKGRSLAQNFDRMFFSEKGELRNEFGALYASLFRNPVPHIAIINALATKSAGMLREEILAASGMSDNSTFLRAMEELIQCGFVRRYTCLGKRSKDAVYQLMDNYTLFYFRFIRENEHSDKHFWTAHYETSLHNAWAGLAFERVCLQHIDQIKSALGFSAVVSSEYSWSHKARSTGERGTQIDLLIDRNDQVINLCEMKYCNTVYAVDKEEDERLRRRKQTFVSETKTTKSVLLTLITTYGLTQGGYSDDIPCQLTMDALFR